MRRQGRIGGLVWQVVTDMGEERALRLYALHDAQGVLDGGMRRMTLMPQSVQKQNIQVLQVRERLLRNVAEIGQVSCGAKAVSIDLGVPMNHRHRLKAGTKQLHRPVDRLEFHLSNAAEFVVGIENVSEHVSQKLGRLGPRVKRDLGGSMKAERSEVINSEDVVRMSMRIKHRIDVLDLRPDRLLAKVRCGIDQYDPPVVFRHDGGTGALVVRI